MLLTFYRFINNKSVFADMVAQSKIAIIAIIIIIPLVSVILWSNESTKNLETNEDEPQVYVSFYPLYETTQAVIGQKTDVKILTPTNVDPHDFDPSVKIIQEMKTADLIILNGGGFESWISNMEFESGQLLDSSNGISFLKTESVDHHEITEEEHEEHEENEEHEEHEVVSDPHIWLNPNLVKIQVKNIAERLSKIDPENSKSYNENASQYIEKLELLDLQIREELSSCSKKDFITYHNAFSYFSNEYGLTQHTITKGVHDHSQPTAKSIEGIIDLAKKLDIKVIFTEDTSDIRISQVIADEIGADVLILSPIATQDKENKNYFERMQENASSLKEALCN